MITTLIMTFVLLLLVVSGMALGVIFSDREIKGSCGGIANVPGMDKPNCTCKNPCDKRKARMAEEAASFAEKPIHFVKRS